MPANQVALLGDNAPVSIDSRQWQPAGVPLDAVMGRVRRPDVDVPLVADHAARQLDHARGAEQVAPGRVAVVPALAHRHVGPPVALLEHHGR